jgi:hypothetical protein
VNTAHAIIAKKIEKEINSLIKKNYGKTTSEEKA